MASRSASSSSWSFSRSFDVSSRMMAFSLWWRICSASSSTCSGALEEAAHLLGHVGPERRVGELGQRQAACARCRAPSPARAKHADADRHRLLAHGGLDPAEDAGQLDAARRRQRPDDAGRRRRTGRNANHTAQYVSRARRDSIVIFGVGKSTFWRAALAGGALLLRLVLGLGDWRSSASASSTGSGPRSRPPSRARLVLRGRLRLRCGAFVLRVVRFVAGLVVVLRGQELARHSGQASARQTIPYFRARRPRRLSARRSSPPPRDRRADSRLARLVPPLAELSKIT